ncbi:hypothetical protein DV736_g335, partial [Chaetothyriales sp. CBS 134916]
MPNTKQKKRKLNNNPVHHHNHHHPEDNALLSHKQIWDDSALIDSWNAALAEYKHYHSLAAQGLDVEEVLDRAEEREEKGLEDGDENGVQEEEQTATTTRKQGAVTDVAHDDEQVLENVKMAYYWAGYYSGLYDAQRTRTRPGPVAGDGRT